MANFNTHISIAAVGSGLTATALLKVGQVSEADALLLAFFGTLGGILPDIDLKYSYPSRMLFSFFAILAAFAAVFSLQEKFAIAELWLTAAGVFLAVRYPLWMIFHNFTTHRGAIHSLAAAALFLFMITTLGYYAFGKSALLAWLGGFFVFGGFILHLLLDELYSVDFVGNQIKRSFGSAFKIIDFKQWISSLLIAVLAAMFWLLTPPTDTLEEFAGRHTRQLLSERFFPEDGWFGTSLAR
ncbi:MAG: metal-dependent hydrolase [Gammaproteobacteria bacterium]|nr:metal-dependent hydrolase [Gammaproteobacteria bacterium]